MAERGDAFNGQGTFCGEELAAYFHQSGRAPEFASQGHGRTKGVYVQSNDQFWRVGA